MGDVKTSHSHTAILEHLFYFGKKFFGSRLKTTGYYLEKII